MCDHMIVRGTGFVRGASAMVGPRLLAHLKYVQYRSREQQPADRDRRLFSATDDHISWRQAHALLMAHSGRSVGFHKIVLSPSVVERSGISDWQQWTRHVMADLATRQKQSLYWVAVRHAHTAHPHVHVVLAGVGSAHRPVFLRIGDFKAMLKSGEAHLEMTWPQLVQRSLADLRDPEWLEYVQEFSYGGGHP